MTDPSAPNGRRWPRGQKFSISIPGLSADETYRRAVLGARSAGRTALEAALEDWARPHGVRAGDGVVLGELRAERRGLADLSRALEGCGIEPREVREAVDRLVAAGLVDALPLASQLGA
jgi:hypothetical protein